MKVAIFGAGAIGGLLGVRLAQAGVDVTFIARGPHLAAMRANGVPCGPRRTGRKRMSQLSPALTFTRRYLLPEEEA